MRMKESLCIALLAMIFLATGISMAEIPDLQGKWIASWNEFYQGTGFVNDTTENGSLIFNFTDQKDRLFSGNMTYMVGNETKVTKELAGAVSLDNKTLYLAEFDGGYDEGTIISDNEIELIHLDDRGEVAIDRLHRTME
jgi:hypothetical protein